MSDTDTAVVEPSSIDEIVFLTSREARPYEKADGASLDRGVLCQHSGKTYLAVAPTTGSLLSHMAILGKLGAVKQWWPEDEMVGLPVRYSEDQQGAYDFISAHGVTTLGGFRVEPWGTKANRSDALGPMSPEWWLVVQRVLWG